jgi:hypothetical protein
VVRAEEVVVVLVVEASKVDSGEGAPLSARQERHDQVSATWSCDVRASTKETTPLFTISLCFAL